MPNCSWNQKSSLCFALIRTPQSQDTQRGIGLFQMALIHASTLHYVNFPSDRSRGTCHILKEEFPLTTLLLPNGISVLCGPLPDSQRERERCFLYLQHQPGSHHQVEASWFSKISGFPTLSGIKPLNSFSKGRLHSQWQKMRIESKFCNWQYCILSTVYYLTFKI